jgi:hypothetical protein
MPRDSISVHLSFVLICSCSCAGIFDNFYSQVLRCLKFLFRLWLSLPPYGRTRILVLFLVFFYVMVFYIEIFGFLNLRNLFGIECEVRRYLILIFHWFNLHRYLLSNFRTSQYFYIYFSHEDYNFHSQKIYCAYLVGMTLIYLLTSEWVHNEFQTLKFIFRLYSSWRTSAYESLILFYRSTLLVSSEVGEKVNWDFFFPIWWTESVAFILLNLVR